MSSERSCKDDHESFTASDNHGDRPSTVADYDSMVERLRLMLEDGRLLPRSEAASLKHSDLLLEVEEEVVQQDMEAPQASHPAPVLHGAVRARRSPPQFTAAYQGKHSPRFEADLRSLAARPSTACISLALSPWMMSILPPRHRQPPEGPKTASTPPSSRRRLRPPEPRSPFECRAPPVQLQRAGLGGRVVRQHAWRSPHKKTEGNVVLTRQYIRTLPVAESQPATNNALTAPDRVQRTPHQCGSEEAALGVQRARQQVSYASTTGTASEEYEWAARLRSRRAMGAVGFVRSHRLPRRPDARRSDEGAVRQSPQRREAALSRLLAGPTRSSVISQQVECLELQMELEEALRSATCRTPRARSRPPSQRSRRISTRT